MTTPLLLMIPGIALALVLLALMAAAGIPGLAAFPAELLVFVGSWSAFPQATLVALVASGLTAVYAVRLLAGLVVATGLWPRALTGWSETTTASLALRPRAHSALPTSFCRGDPPAGGRRLDAARHAGKPEADHRHLQGLCGADGFLLARSALYC